MANIYSKKIPQIVESLKKYQPEKIILFGSFARGDYTEDSDIDFLVIKKGIEKKRMLDRMDEVSDLIEFGLPVEVIVYSPKEIKYRLKYNDFFLEDVLKEGKVLYEKKSLSRRMVSKRRR